MQRHQRISGAQPNLFYTVPADFTDTIVDFQRRMRSCGRRRWAVLLHELAELRDMLKELLGTGLKRCRGDIGAKGVR
jgi:hypothetical protein